MSTLQLSVRPRHPMPARIPAAVHCGVVELRRYVLHPFKRDVLIDLFERELVEAQEANGIRLIGTFRDLDAPDRFVWLRGFADMRARTRGLTAFYDGPVWRAHREAANRTMVDSDDVLLMRPLSTATGFDTASAAIRPRDAVQVQRGIVVAHVHYLQARACGQLHARFEREALPLLRNAGIDVVAVLGREPGTNGFPRLPIREGEHALAWFARYPDPDAHARSEDLLASTAAWRGVEAALHAAAASPAEILRLQPTARSRLPGFR
jgi:hypothetical protein